MEEELFTPKEACKFLKISIATLWRFTKDGDLTVIKRKAYVRYRKSDLLAFLDRHTIKGVNECGS